MITNHDLRIKPLQIKPKDIHMNWDQIEGNWKELKGSIQQQWAKLTDEDLDAMDGKREALSGKIQHSYGIEKEEAEQQLDDWQSTRNDAVNLYNSDINGELDDEMNNLSNTTHTNNFGYDDDVGKETAGHHTAGNVSHSMQEGKTDNGPGSHVPTDDDMGLPGSDEDNNLDDLGTEDPDTENLDTEDLGIEIHNPLPDVPVEVPANDDDDETPHEDKSVDQT